jgi:hypothetical protein
MRMLNGGKLKLRNITWAFHYIQVTNKVVETNSANTKVTTGPDPKPVQSVSHPLNQSS